MHKQKLRHVGLAQHHGTSVLERGHGHGVLLAVMVAASDHAERRRGADDFEVVFDADRQTMQRQKCVATLACGVGGFRGFAGAVVQRQDDGRHFFANRLASFNQ
ncbi:MAG TPA: hypothetical protein PKW11_10630 [Pseudomonadota bacterium]|nr:hypothetical protein [Pseudomonadota bacterium]